MKLKFKNVIIATQDEQFTADEQIDLYELLKKDKVVDLISEDEQFLLISQLFGIHYDLRVYLEKTGYENAKAIKMVEKVKKIMSKLTFKVESVTIPICGDSDEELEWRKNEFYQYGKYHCQADGEITIDGLSKVDIESIRENCNQLNINIGIVTIDEI